MSERVPEGWQNLLVKDAFEIGRGRVISKDEIRDNFGQYPVFSSQSKNKGEMGSIRTFDFEGEYITWTTDGAYAGTVFYRSGKFNCTNVCGTLRNSGRFEVNLRFAAEYLSTVAKNHVSYVGNPKLMNGTFGEIELLLPPLSEQKKIASILTSVDEVIENTQKQIDKLQDLKKATMNELLTKGIGHTEFKESELGRIPKSWEIRFIGDLCEIVTGKRDTQNKEKFGKYPFFVRSQKVERISSYSYDGEAILTAGDGVGTGKIYHYVNGKFDYHQRVYKLSDFADEIFGKFLFYYFSNNFLKQVQKFSAKGSVESVRMEMITGMKLPVPPRPEQIRISKTLSAIEISLEKSVEKLSQTKALKKSLMQDLLTGKVRVQVN